MIATTEFGAVCVKNYTVSAVALFHRALLQWQKKLCEGSVEKLEEIIVAPCIGVTGQTQQKALKRR